ncbi:MAG: hypothetical protein D6726_12660 [Nitrospirae bacterium]|nr:MAG: hypothetical protein D6726_12660 [Nitrospirota bacterium]
MMRKIIMSYRKVISACIVILLLSLVSAEATTNNDLAFLKRRQKFERDWGGSNAGKKTVPSKKDKASDDIVTPGKPAKPEAVTEEPKETIKDGVSKSGQEEVSKEEVKNKTLPDTESKSDGGKVLVSEELLQQKNEKGDEKGINFYFDDADVYEVINTVFGEILKVNYIVDPKISGRVNFRTVTPVPKSEVLKIMEIILRLNGIAVVETGGLYRLILLPDISKEPAPVRFGKAVQEVRGTSIVQIVPLDYIESSEMVKILTPLLTKGGMIVDIPGKNYIMISDTDRNVERLLQVVRAFDVETIKDMLQPKIYVYSLQNAEAKHVAELLQQLFLGGVRKASKPTSLRSANTTKKKKTPPGTVQKVVSVASSLEEPLVMPGTKMFPDEITNSIVILATPKDYALIEDVIKKLDVVPRRFLSRHSLQRLH